MTALLELKQKIKNFYGRIEIFLLPVLKFLLALGYFMWINEALGYMVSLNSPFVVLILALLCAILPPNVIVFVGFALIIGHCYALGIEVAAFALVLILFMLIMFLRFSSKSNLVLVFTPLAFSFQIPALLPIGGGLLGDAFACMPAGCGVILFYFIKLIHGQASVLAAVPQGDADMVAKIKTISDGMMNNQEMWLSLIAVVAVILLVNIIRTRSFDYAWRIAIVAGGVAYAFIMLGGGLFLNANVDMIELVVGTVISLVIGILLEFFVFGGDYTRTERLEYEDDEYYYYVKAVPKAAVATSDRSIKKINAERMAEEERKDVEVVKTTYANPIFEKSSERDGMAEELAFTEPVAPVAEDTSMNPEDFEKKLEESLRDL